MKKQNRSRATNCGSTVNYISNVRKHHFIHFRLKYLFLHDKSQNHKNKCQPLYYVAILLNFKMQFSQKLPLTMSCYPTLCFHAATKLTQLGFLHLFSFNQILIINSGFLESSKFWILKYMYSSAINSEICILFRTNQTNFEQNPHFDSTPYLTLGKAKLLSLLFPQYFLEKIFLHFIMFLQFRKTKLENIE